MNGFERIRYFFYIYFLLLFFCKPGIAAPKHCTAEHARGWHMESVGDLAGEDPWYFPVYYIYKWLNPIRHTDCSIENFFADQDLHFARDLDRAAQIWDTITVSAVGDMMVRRRMSDKSAAHLYADVEKELFSADIVLGNLETPTDPDKSSRSFPAYNLSPDLARLYLGQGRDKGFTLVSTANNHVLDQKEQGLLATLDYLDRLPVPHVGTSHSVEERDRRFPIIEVRGIKVAFLAYTFSTNGRDIPPGREYEVNLVQLNTLAGPPDISLIEEQIKTARQRGADVVAVSLHWSMELEFYPPQRIIDLGHRIADAGADIIIGHHPHVIGPMERYIPPHRSRGVPEVLITYSLGNFIPDAYKVQTQTGIILHVSLAVGDISGQPAVWISRVDYTPVWWYCRRLSGKRDYRVIDIDKALGEDARQRYPYFRFRNWHEVQAAGEIVGEYLGPVPHQIH